jgi:hypothetical protein
MHPARRRLAVRARSRLGWTLQRQRGWGWSHPPRARPPQWYGRKGRRPGRDDEVQVRRRGPSESSNQSTIWREYWIHGHPGSSSSTKLQDFSTIVPMLRRRLALNQLHRREVGPVQVAVFFPYYPRWHSCAICAWSLTPFFFIFFDTVNPHILSVHQNHRWTLNIALETTYKGNDLYYIPNFSLSA